MKTRKFLRVKCILLLLSFILVYMILNLSTCNKGSIAEAKYFTIEIMNNKLLSKKNRIIKRNFLDTLKVNNLIELYKSGLPVKGLEKYIVLEKSGEGCYVYKLPVNKLLSEKEYKDYYLYKKGRVLFFKKGDYNSKEKCKFEDYEKCNIYLTEKGILKYDDDYECDNR